MIPSAILIKQNMKTGYQPVTVISLSIALHHMNMSLPVILPLLLMKSLDHWYQKGQNIRNDILSIGTSTEKI